MKRPRREEARGALAGLKKAARHEITAVRRRRRKGREASYGSVQRKVRELQTLVPGGRALQADQLFVRTAEYIFQLRLQVYVLRALSEMYMP